jgi:anti-sigma28 factor (negative regulator of flagellin synthesis)
MDVAGRQDTALFLFDWVKTQALAPDSAPQIEAGKLRVDALRRGLADGSYDVPPELIAGAIVAEARV